MINRTKLLADLKVQVRDLESDLRQRFATNNSDYRTRLTADWQAARDAGRTSEDVAIWAEAQFTQSAIAWVLACVFVRFCEDNAMLDTPLLVGTDARGQSAVTRQEGFYLQNPTASDNDYLRDVFGVAARLPGLSDVMRVQRTFLEAPVSADQGKQLIRFFRSADADTGVLLHDFADPDWNTRFLGDLYQDLSEAAREKYALLQTPEFVESFILDRTLTPALDVYTLEEVDLIDPTCGSGHFLLGAFERLAPRWLRQMPGNVNVAIQETLNRIAGVDLNPYAVVIARFRLLIAALKMANVHKLRLAPSFHLNIETGDSLLHGFDQRDYTRAQASLGLNTPQENLGSAADHLYRHAFAAENLAATNTILGRKYAVVVGNPPYINVGDAAVSALYRERYESCFRKYALVAPFCERFWALCRYQDQSQRCGFVGLIVSNSFMKREFGKKLVEGFFPKIDLTHVIDSSGATIPGHQKDTVIMFGRARQPVAGVVRAVLGIKGDPGIQSDPDQGPVWQAILHQIDQRDSISEWISVSDTERAVFSKHPWSIKGGGAAELREQLESRTDAVFNSAVGDAGFFGISAADDVYLLPLYAPRTIGFQSEFFKPVVSGDEVRDWQLTPEQSIIFPYKDGALADIRSDSATFKYLWPFRNFLWSRTTFAKKTYREEGRTWWEWHQIALRRIETPLTITLAEVATHNHFVLDRGGNVFKQTAPIIKLPARATVDDHLGILGLLNSSTACFWFKQVCFQKDTKSGWDERFAFDGTKVGQFPLVAQRPTAKAREIDRLTTLYANHLPSELFLASVPSRAEIDQSRIQAARVRNEMIAWQEELDWEVYQYYNVLDEDLTYAGNPPEVKFGERAFEIVLAQDCAAGSKTTIWFERHNGTPTTTVPSQWPQDYRELVERRIAAIRRNRDLALIERPECKRRWAAESWESLEKAALENWLLTRLEAADLWPRDANPAPRLRSVRELVDALSGNDEFRRAIDLYAGLGSDAHTTLAALIQQSWVPYLSSMRYSESGLRKHAVWQKTWALQRREDAIDAEVVRQMAGAATDDISSEQERRKKAEVGAIAVPPKYKPEDFREGTYWKLRGALDVPKERFVSFPGLERSNDAGSPMLLWAGYDAKARALALTGYLYEMLQREGADAARLTPALAGLDELLPWVHQWHPEIDDDLGMSTGDYLQGLLDAQLAQHGLTLTAVRAWQPPAPVRRTRGRRASAPAQA
jgi:hypothetical protein